MAHIVVFGATGSIGRQIVREAQARGHEVTAVVRDPAKLGARPARRQVIRGDVLNPADVLAAAAGHDAVISAVGPGPDQDPQMLVEAARSLLDALPRAGVRRLIVVGGAGSLEVAPGVQLLDTPEFPEEWKPLARAHRDALAVYRQNEDLEWTYISPAGFIAAGPRTGHYRTAGDQLLRDSQGKSSITIDDFAIAVIDELEHPQHVRQRFTAAY
ncbi:MAG: NAD(P)-dependent oxidoreductase [Nitrososphaerales archaeon]